jgi:hypothetical protein
MATDLDTLTAAVADRNGMGGDCLRPVNHDGDHRTKN